MYYLLSILSGAVIALMITVNGALSSRTGLYLSTVLIHIVGLVLISLVMASKRIRPLPDRGVSARFYLGGVIGVATVVFNSLGFSGISVSAITALGLLGQSVTSLAVDRFGWFHMPKRPFDRRKWAGLCLVLLGILFMLRSAAPEAFVPVVVSLLAGVTIVTARTVNAELAAHSGVIKSTFYNYVTGLVCSALVLLAVGGESFPGAAAPPPWMLLGGLLGVVTVFTFNVIVAKIPSFYMTLLLFVGQVFAGMVIDILLTGAFAPENLTGGVFVALGLSFNLWVDRREAIAQKTT